jgi:hypothetical protein
MTDPKLMIFAIQAGDTNVTGLVAIQAMKEAAVGKLGLASG